MLGKKMTGKKRRTIATLMAVSMIASSLGVLPINAYAASKKVVKKLSISKNYLELEEGESDTIKYKVTATKGTRKSIILKISDRSIVSAKVIKGKINIVAKEEGETTITVATKAKNKNGKKIAKKIKVTVLDDEDNLDYDYEDNEVYDNDEKDTREKRSRINLTPDTENDLSKNKVNATVTDINATETTEMTTESTNVNITENTTEMLVENTSESITENTSETSENDKEDTTETKTDSVSIEKHYEKTGTNVENKIQDNIPEAIISTDETSEDNIVSEIESKEEQIPSIMYRAHIENNGWLSTVKDGETAGSTSQSKRLEGLKITLDDKNGNSMIKYCAHVEGTGWQSWKTSGQLAGTTGEGKQMEGIKIELTEKYAKQYDIYYRAHVSNFGWLGWASNGQLAGTEGLALAMEALEIKLVKKNELFDTGKKCAIEKPQYTYQAHVEGTGWQNEVKENMVAGTEGKEKRIEAVKININDEKGISMVEYRAHVQNVGWQNWKNSGEVAGTTGQSKQIEAIQIKLKGDYAKYYDIYYRLHVQDYGWLGWAKNGEMAGTTGCALRAEAMQIKIVYKGRTIDLCGEAYHNTVKNSASTDVQGRINELRSNLVGTYFNVGRNGGCGSKSSGHACSGCLTSNIISQTWFKNLFGNVSTNQFPLTPTSDVCITRAGYSCAGFASFAEWYLYRKNDGDTVNVNKVGTFDFNYTNVNANAKVGDIIRLEYTGGGHGHSAIITGWDQSGLTVLDSNWSSSCNCLVQEHKIYYSSYGWITISRP